MKQIVVNTGGGSYPISVASGLLDQAGHYITQLWPSRRCVVVSDSHVWALYGQRLTQSLAAAGLTFDSAVLPPGEASKSMDSVMRLYEVFVRNQLNRDDFVIAFGGGVMGDLCGFAAATYMRGIDFVQIPTTLLAQVDSSVGGKTGVNIAGGKNLVGAFHQPRLVLIDPDVLDTLSGRDYAAGMAEVVKYGAIFSESLFCKLEINRSGQRLAPALTADVIAACCTLKKTVVEADERDHGDRMLLNFGHTFGHAIEKEGGYETYSHGEAVAVGMCLAAALGESLRRTEQGMHTRLANLLEKYGLPTRTPYPIDVLLPHMLLDKKNQNHALRLVLLTRLGHAFVHPIDAQEVLSWTP